MVITESVHIEAAVDQVFDLFTDLNEIQNRVTGIKSIEVLEGPSKMQNGTKWKESRVMMGKEASEIMTVRKLEKNRSYIVDAASHGMKYTSVYTFETKDNGTLVKMEFTGTPVSFLAKLMTPIGYLFRGATKKALATDMYELKSFAESS